MYNKKKYMCHMYKETESLYYYLPLIPSIPVPTPLIPSPNTHDNTFDSLPFYPWTQPWLPPLVSTTTKGLIPTLFTHDNNSFDSLPFYPRQHVWFPPLLPMTTALITSPCTHDNKRLDSHPFYPWQQQFWFRPLLPMTTRLIPSHFIHDNNRLDSLPKDLSP